MSLSHHSNKLRENLPSINQSLRTFFDSNDRIRMALSYHGFRRSGGHESRRPKWVDSPAAIREFLIRSFPKLATDPEQRERAARWAYIIHLYWQAGQTRGQIALELGISFSQVHNLLNRIRRVAKGQSANNTGAHGRKRGRPRNS
jgi:DNA-binding CsgD family transcriptional regulator